MKRFISGAFLLLLIPLFLMVTGCKPGIFQMGGQTVTVIMPNVAITAPIIAANIFIGAKEGDTVAPDVECFDPGLTVRAIFPPTTEPVIVIYDLKAKNPIIYTPLGPKPSGLTGLSTVIEPADKKPLRILRGPDLAEDYSLSCDSASNTLNIRLKESPDPLKPADSVPRMEGVVARIIANSSFMPGPVFPADIMSFEKENVSVKKYPITLTKASANSVVEINTLDIQVKAANFLWLSPGDLFFPNVVIEPNPEQTALAADEAIFRIENVICITETAILAPPDIEQQGFIAEIKSLIINREWNEAVFWYNGEQYSTQLSRFFSSASKKLALPTTWGNIKR